MSYKSLSLLVLSLFLLLGCQHGAESIPELSGKLFDALKAGSHKKLDACMPSLSDMEKGYELYLGDMSKSKEERKADALDKAASVRINVSNQFDKVLVEAKELKIDWSKNKIRDFKYVEKDHKEGYKEASVRMILENDNKDKNVIVYRAYLFEKRWYLVGDLGWEH